MSILSIYLLAFWPVLVLSKFSLPPDTAISTCLQINYYRELFASKRWTLERFDLDWDRVDADSQTQELETLKRILANEIAVVEIYFSINVFNISLNISKVKHTMDLANLTSPFEKSSEVYEQFLSIYRSHFFSQSAFGGAIVRQAITHDLKKFSENPNLYINQLVAQFKTDFNISPSELSYINQNISWSSVKDTVSGGMQSGPLSFPFDFTGWRQNLEKDPKLIGGKLRPISDMIPEPNIKSNLLKAIRVKFLKTYLHQMKQLLESLPDNSIGYRYVSGGIFKILRVNDLLHRIEKCAREIVPNEAEVKAIADIVEPALEYIQKRKFWPAEFTNYNWVAAKDCYIVKF